MSAHDLGSNRPSFCKRLSLAFSSSKSSEEKPPEGQKPQLDQNVSKSLDAWAKNHNPEEGNSLDLLKAQLERYEFELAIRRMKQKADKQEGGVSATDARLPYEKQSISANWKAALSKIGSLKKTSVVSESVSKSKVKTGPDASPTASTAASTAQPTPATPTPTDTSTSTSTSSIEDIMKPCALSDLLLEIMKDAEKSPEEAKKDAVPEISFAEYAAMSRKDMPKFEKTTLENTKKCLLTSQPTKEELEKWQKAEGQEVVLQRYPKINFSKEQVEIKTFCPSCKPRHWETKCK